MVVQSKSLAWALGASLVLLGGSTEAQEAPQMFSSLSVEIKPGTAPQFEEFLSKFKAAAEQTDSPLRWTAAQSVSGSPIYTFTRPFQSFAAFGDAFPDLAKAYGAEEGARLMGLLQSSAVSESSSIYMLRQDLSRPWPQLQGSPAAVLFIDIEVRPGKELVFEDYAKKLVEATNATAPNEHWQMRQRMFGEGGSAMYRVVVVFPEWANLDMQPAPIQERISEHFGATEAYRLEAGMTDAIEGVTQRLNRARPDLARPPGT